MLHKRASEANDKNDNTIIGSDLASSKKRRIDFTESSSDKSSSILASGSSRGFHGDSVVQQIDMAFGNSNRQEIDEDLHSRQLAVYGRETMRRLFASNVLISGMHGLGAEIGMYFIGFMLRLWSPSSLWFLKLVETLFSYASLLEAVNNCVIFKDFTL